MLKLDFNTGWTCRPLSREGAPVPVTLPHDAMRTEARVNTSRGEGNIGWFEGGDYEYKKVFILPEECKGKQLTLEFESVYHNAEIYLNGEKAAFRPYGYTNFYVELNPWLKEGENEIRVVARNADQPNSRWYSGTGIYRPVWLFAAEEKHLVMNSVRVRTLGIHPARIRVEAKASTVGEVKLEILDGERVIVKSSIVAGQSGEVSFDAEVPDARLWDVDSPNLYRAS